MKILLSLFVSLFVTTLGLNAFATTCYVLPEKYVNAPNPLPNSLPLEFCLEAAHYDAQKNAIAISSRTDSKLFANLKVTRVVPQMTGVVFVSEATLVSTGDASICSRAVEQKIFVSGLASSNGQVNPAALKIYIQHETSPDTCHSPYYSKAYEYELK
jgi:hypothetical protein